MLPELGRRMDKHSEDFGKGIDSILKTYKIEITELNDTINDLKHMLRDIQCSG